MIETIIARNKKRLQERAELKVRLENENGLENHPKRHMLWNKAWDLGHTAGDLEVEMYYLDLMELVQ